jgi:hypothetical protein
MKHRKGINNQKKLMLLYIRMTHYYHGSSSSSYCQYTELPYLPEFMMRVLCPFTGLTVIHICILRKYFTDTTLFLSWHFKLKTCVNNSHANAAKMYGFQLISNYLTLLQVFLEKLVVAHKVKKCLAFIEPECVKQTCHYTLLWIQSTPPNRISLRSI